MILPNVFENFFGIFFSEKPVSSKIAGGQFENFKFYLPAYINEEKIGHIYTLSCFKSESDVIRQLELLVRLKR